MRHFIESGNTVKVFTKGKINLTLDSKQLYTNVDIVTQAIFEKTIKNVYPSLEIIGEEDLDSHVSHLYLFNDRLLIDHYSKKQALEKRLEENLTSLIEDTKKVIITKEEEVIRQKHYKHFDHLIKSKRVKILLDPLDATHSFINKNYNEATILTGVLVDNKPYIGCITSPFYNYSPENKKTGMVTYFNIPNYGIFSFKKQKSLLFDNVDNYKIEQVKLTKRNSIFCRVSDKPLETEINPELKLIVSRFKVDKLNQMCKIYFLNLVKPLVSENVIKQLQMKVDNGMGYRSIKMIEDGYYFMTVKSSNLVK